jgi:hypothetical protein
VPLVRPNSLSREESAPYDLGRRVRVMDPSMRSDGVRGAILRLRDRESPLSGETFVRGLPRVSKLGVDEPLIVSVPRIESVKDESETGV